MNSLRFVTLGSVASIKGGTGFPERLQGGKSGIPFIKVSDMNTAGNQRFIATANNYITSELASRLRANVFDKNSIVFAKVGAALLLNRRRLLAEPTVIDNNMMAVTPISADPFFLYQVLLTVDFGLFVQPGAVPSVNQSQVSGIVIPDFTLDEQRRIAAILSAMDEQIEKTEALIGKKKAVLQGLRQELLSPGAGGCRSISEMPLPLGWSLNPLSAFIDKLESGVSVNADNRQAQGDEIGVLKTSCVYGGKFKPEEHKAIWEKDRVRARTAPRTGAIIVSRMNTPELVGESGYVEYARKGVFLPDRLWQALPRLDVPTDFRWLAQILQLGLVKKQIQEAATGTSNSGYFGPT